MQDLQSNFKKKPGLAVDVLALAEKHNLPRTAAACERHIATSFQRMPRADRQCISQEACLRIIRALTEHIDRAEKSIEAYLPMLERHNFIGVPALASADTMLSWR